MSINSNDMDPGYLIYQKRRTEEKLNAILARVKDPKPVKGTDLRERYETLLENLNSLKESIRKVRFKHVDGVCEATGKDCSRVWTDTNRSGIKNSCEHCNDEDPPEDELATKISNMVSAGRALYE